MAQVSSGFPRSARHVGSTWVFDIATGLIKDLKLDIDKIVDSIRDIYSIAEKV